MIEYLDKVDRQLFLFINGIHHEFWDSLMFQITCKAIWIPMYILIIYSVIKVYKKNAIWILAGVILAVIFSDQLITTIIKPFFGRLRPSHDPGMQDLVHLVNGYSGGRYSFVSGHAATSFGMAFYLWLTVRDKIKWVGYLFLWATVYSYSRIYLGVHYPADIILGALVGMAVSYFIFNSLIYIKQRWKDNSSLS